MFPWAREPPVLFAYSGGRFQWSTTCPGKFIWQGQMNTGICFVCLGKRASISVCVLWSWLSVVFNLSWQGKISEHCIKLASVSEFFCLTVLAQPLFVAASPEPKAFPSPSFACLPGMQSASQPTVLLTAGCPNPRGLPLRSKPSSPFPLKPHPSKPRPLNP